jgi:hypothetical protein
VRAQGARATALPCRAHGARASHRRTPVARRVARLHAVAGARAPGRPRVAAPHAGAVDTGLAAARHAGTPGAARVARLQAVALQRALGRPGSAAARAHSRDAGLATAVERRAPLAAAATGLCAVAHAARRLRCAAAPIVRGVRGRAAVVAGLADRSVVAPIGGGRVGFRVVRCPVGRRVGRTLPCVRRPRGVHGARESIRGRVRPEPGRRSAGADPASCRKEPCHHNAGGKSRGTTTHHFWWPLETSD